MSYIISQIFVIFAYGFLGVTYLTKRKNAILILNALSTVCFAVSYIFLSAWAGVMMSTISLFRNLVFFLFARFTANTKNCKLSALFIVLGLISLDFVLCLTINTGIFSFGKVFDIFPYIATIIYTIAIWNEKGKWYKVFGICSSLAWIIYNIFLRSIFGVILETVMIVCGIVGLIKHRNVDKNLSKGEI